jgi:ATP-dependent DNA helicase RecG
MPPGRQPVRTWRVQDPAKRTRAWSFIRERLSEGRQLYVVCPRVGEAEDTDQDSLPFNTPDPVEPVRNIPTPGQLTGSTEELFRELKSGELQDFKIGMIHGRMNTQKKADTMDAFRTGELQVLVSTTVIEVGVDVPNSTLMVVQQAERFGLSQLHQLRGRIGRGIHQGYCCLFSDATNPDVVKRLDTLEKCSDGFRIAEVDFELRGPGDILGKRQHGAMPLRFARLLRDRPLVEETRNAAFDLVESGRFDEPDFVPLKTSVLERFGELMDLPRSG